MRDGMFLVCWDGDGGFPGGWTIPCDERVDVHGWGGGAGVGFPLGRTSDGRMRGRGVFRFKLRGHCPRLEHHRLMIHTYCTHWWPVTHTHTRTHTILSYCSYRCPKGHHLMVIDRRQTPVAEWVALRPIFEACAKETGYE